MIRPRAEFMKTRTYCGVHILIFAGDAETADGKRRITLTKARAAVDCWRCNEAIAAEDRARAKQWA